MQYLLQHLADMPALTKLVGKSPSFLSVLRDLPAIAASQAVVLITGETGTGKELVARAVHYLSDKASFPFVAVNCGSLSEGLLEDEFFGHERGSFTGADCHRRGVIAQAENGSLFLDEVDTLSPKAQVDLLRVLQDKTYRPIGGSSELRANIRVIAASNAPVERLVREGALRSDLFYRLYVFSVHLPALRERKEDIIPLAVHFLTKHASSVPSKLELSTAAQEFLLANDWPGNVRELESAIVRGIHFAPGNVIEIEHLRMTPAAVNEIETPLIGPGRLDSFRKMKNTLVERFERDYLMRLMVEHRGNVTEAARYAGKERRDLGKLLKRHHLNPERFRSGQLSGTINPDGPLGEISPTRSA